MIFDFVLTFLTFPIDLSNLDDFGRGRKTPEKKIWADVVIFSTVFFLAAPAASRNFIYLLAHCPLRKYLAKDLEIWACSGISINFSNKELCIFADADFRKHKKEESEFASTG